MKTIEIKIQENLVTEELLRFIDAAESCIKLYACKNHDYGNSFDKGMDVIGETYGIGRIYDKVNRLITLNKLKEIAETAKVNESMDDTLIDLACYSMMYIAYNAKKKGEKDEK